MTTINHQRGFVLSRWLLAIVLLGVIAFGATVIGPTYWDYGRAVEVVDISLTEANSESVSTLSDEQFADLSTATRRQIMRRLQDRGLAFITAEQIQIERDLNQEMVVVLRYEDRRGLLANLDYVARFNYRTDGL